MSNGMEFDQMSQKKTRKKSHVRHGTGHADQRIDATKADTNGPQSCASHDAFADVLVACSKTQDCTMTNGDAFVDIAVGMVWEAGIESGEPEGIEIVCDKGCGL